MRVREPAPVGEEPRVSTDVSPTSLYSERGVLNSYRRDTLTFGVFLPHSWLSTDGIDQREGQVTSTTGHVTSTRHPVIVFLHGRGESGGFAVSYAQSLPWLLVKGNNASFAASFPFIVIAPQCPAHCARVNQWTKEVRSHV